MSISSHLRALDACGEAVTWVGKRRSLQRAWDECPRGDWLLWYAAKRGVDRKTLVLAACACAKTALVHVTEGEDRPRIAIETAEAWCRGEATVEQVRQARDAAVNAYAAAAAAYASAAAAYASASDAYAAAASAYASASDASAAAASAYASASDASAAASASDASAAASAYASASDASARKKAHAKMADLVRCIIPTVPA